jgi:hypothetical protein
MVPSILFFYLFCLLELAFFSFSFHQKKKRKKMEKIKRKHQEEETQKNSWKNDRIFNTYKNHPQNLMDEDKHSLKQIVRIVQGILQNKIEDADYLYEDLYQLTRKELLLIHMTQLKAINIATEDRKNDKDDNSDYHWSRRQALKSFDTSSYNAFKNTLKKINCGMCNCVIEKGSDSFFFHICRRDYNEPLSEMCYECFQKQRIASHCFFCNMPNKASNEIIQQFQKEIKKENDQ